MPEYTLFEVSNSSDTPTKYSLGVMHWLRGSTDLQPAPNANTHLTLKLTV